MKRILLYILGAKVQRCIVGLMVLALVAGCGSPEARVARLVQEWTGKEILFPAHPVFTVQGRDTVVPPVDDTPYKVVVYVDSVGCMGCKLQLPRWKAWIAYVDSVAPGTVSFCFYLQSSDVRGMYLLLRRNEFTHPVCVDITGEMQALNRFPAEDAFHTYLVDSDNKVLAIGNPIHNVQVKQLYLSMITGQPSAAAARPVTTVEVDRPEVDLGTFVWSEERVDSLSLRNTGQELMVIHDITTNCGCLRVEFPREPIRPGATARIKLRYKADHAEMIHKVFHIYGNFADDTTLTVKVKGKAE